MFLAICSVKLVACESPTNILFAPHTGEGRQTPTYVRRQTCLVGECGEQVTGAKPPSLPQVPG